MICKKRLSPLCPQDGTARPGCGDPKTPRTTPESSRCQLIPRFTRRSRKTYNRHILFIEFIGLQVHIGNSVISCVQYIWRLRDAS